MIKVYKYGCLQPESLPVEAEDQLILANKLWNKLVELDRSVWNKYDQLWLSQSPVRDIEDRITQLQVNLSDLREETKAAKISSRSASVSLERRQQISDITKEIKELRSSLKLVKSDLKESLNSQRDKLFAEHKEAVKFARQDVASQGLHWGNYNAVLSSYQVASKRVHKSGNHLRFHHFTGEGSWSVQIQTPRGYSPVVVADLFDSSSRIRNSVQIDPVDFSNWDTIPRSERRRRSSTVLHFRVSSKDRQPIWIHLPMKMHRPIPEGASIKGVVLKREKLSRKWVYNVCFTVDEPDQLPTPARYAVAVDLGWRKLSDGSLRVGTFVGEDDGEMHSICLPPKIIGGFEQADRIKSHRDEHFNTVVSGLKGWMDCQTALPDWLEDRTAYLTKWRSHDKFMSLVLYWADNRFEGDKEIFDLLDSWIHREKHLQDFEVNLRDRLVGYRKEIFRVAASKLSNKYATLLIEDFNLQDISRRPQVETEDTYQGKLSRAYRTIASPGVLRDCLVQAFTSRQREVKKLDPKNTTLIHSMCGNSLSVDFSSYIEVECPYCGVMFDQDKNACMNMLGMQEQEPVLV